MSMKRANAWALLGLLALLPREVRAHPSRGFEGLRRTSPWQIACDYLQLGIEHLVTGFDHLLFVLALLLLVRDLRERLLALTAFTLAHSITLCLAALSLVELPARPIEIGIAASLLVLALEILVRQRRGDREPRRPWLMAASFGLLHGLGFASALAETGLPPHAVALSLFGFNLGVEIGQLAVVLAMLPMARIFTRWLPGYVSPLRTLAALAIALLAGFWCVERALYAH